MLMALGIGDVVVGRISYGVMTIWSSVMIKHLFSRVRVATIHQDAQMNLHSVINDLCSIS